MDEVRIKLHELVFDWTPEHGDDEIRLFTNRGIHHTGQPMGHECTIGTLSCGDTTDNEDAQYQIANLFCAAPDMLDVLKSLENDDGSIPPHIWQMRNDAIYKAEEIPTEEEIE